MCIFTSHPSRRRRGRGRRREGAGSDQGASVSPVAHFPPCMSQIITNFCPASASPSAGLRAAREFSISDIRMNCTAVACCIKTRKAEKRAGGCPRRDPDPAVKQPHNRSPSPGQFPLLPGPEMTKKYDNTAVEIGTKRPAEQAPTMISPRPECLSTQLSFYLHIFRERTFWTDYLSCAGGRKEKE